MKISCLQYIICLSLILNMFVDLCYEVEENVTGKWFFLFF